MSMEVVSVVSVVMCRCVSVSVSVVCRYGAGQLKVMFVGGPNQRKDYHIEEGEEVS